MKKFVVFLFLSSAFAFAAETHNGELQGWSGALYGMYSAEKHDTADNCVGVKIENDRLTEKQIKIILENKFFREQGEAFCLSWLNFCKHKCIPLTVNGKTK